MVVAWPYERVTKLKKSVNIMVYPVTTVISRVLELQLRFSDEGEGKGRESQSAQAFYSACLGDELKFEW